MKSLDELKLAVMRGDPVALYGQPNHDGTYYNGSTTMGAIDSGASHWIAVTGYDPATNTFTVNDPLSRGGTLQLTQAQLQTFADFSLPSVAVHRPA